MNFEEFLWTLVCRLPGTVPRKIFCSFSQIHIWKTNLWNVKKKSNVWNFDLDQKWQSDFFQNLRSCAPEVNFIYGYKRNLRKGDLFKLIRVRVEKQLCEAQKKWKTNVWNLVQGRKMAKSACLRQEEVFFFLGTVKRRAKESYLSCLESDLKNKFLK